MIILSDAENLVDPQIVLKLIDQHVFPKVTLEIKAEVFEHDEISEIQMKYDPKWNR